jgi:RimJ/RimL family protein N-acetyltransferase
MDHFKQIIDTYLINFSHYESGKVIFECDYGELIFYKRYSSICILEGIYINPKYRNKGYCREILHYIIDQCSNNNFKCFCIEDVISKILYNYLLRFTYKNKKFKNTKSGFIYIIKN